jgi:hypothetical protein
MEDTVLKQWQDFAVGGRKWSAEHVAELGTGRNAERLKNRGVQIGRSARLRAGKGTVAVAAAIDLPALNAAAS